MHPTTHVINTLSHSDIDQILEGNNAPTVSTEARLELLRLVEVEANTDVQDYQPIIMDTGASLAITGNKQDFVPYSYQEVTSLTLGGMTAGANIAGVGNVVWTLQCNDGDQMAIVLKYCFVPSANTRLLSPQQNFDKQNGQSGKIWGDKEAFYLEYKDKPIIAIKYSSDSNLPIVHTITVTPDHSNQLTSHLLSGQV